MMKKVLSLVLVLTLVLALAVPAFATDDKDVTRDGLTITIGRTQKNAKYTVYKILDLKTYDATLGAYRYVTDETELPWNTLKDLEATVQDGTSHKVSDFLKRDEAAKEDGVQYVTWIDEKVHDTAAAQTLAQVLKKAAEAGKLDKVKSETKTAAADNAEVMFDGLTPGYYLVVSDSGVLAGMDTAQKDANGKYVVTINEKNEVPTLDKEVQDLPEGTWGASNDANIGDTVNFEITVHAKKGAEEYIVHDTMTKGLTFNADSLKIVNGDYTLVKDTDYYLKTSKLVDTCTFHVEFTKAYLDATFGKTDSVDADLVITYNCELNKDALVYEETNKNEAHLEYGENHLTVPKETTTNTFDFNIHKYGKNSDGTDYPALKDAHFSLFKNEACTDKIYFDVMGEVASKNAYRVNSDATATAEGITDDLVTPASGDIRVYGLDEGTYNLTDAVMKVAIAADGTVKFLDAENGSIHNTIQVLNNAGAELPSTGGIGTTIFYVIGGLLVCAAVILLVTKKKVNN